MTGQTLELERPERVVEHSPGLTHSLDYGKEGLAVNATRIGAPVRNTIETFWARVEVTGACWLWTGGLTDEGYGYYWLNGRTYGAHRIAYLHLVGEVPDGMHLDHLCRIRNCVNPDHLEVVTPTVNSDRANGYRAEADLCNNGHEWTPENTLALGDYSKRCRQCILVRGHRRKGIAPPGLPSRTRTHPHPRPGVHSWR